MVAGPCTTTPCEMLQRGPIVSTVPARPWMTTPSWTQASSSMITGCTLPFSSNSSARMTESGPT